MNHLEFAAHESRSLAPTRWESWVKAAERIVGHSLDGDRDTDGYCLDDAYTAWERGSSPQQYAATVRH